MDKTEILAKLEAAYNSAYKRLDAAGLTQADVEAAADKIGRGWSKTYRVGPYRILEVAGPNFEKPWTVIKDKPRPNRGTELIGILTTPEEDFGTKKGGGSNEPA